MVVAADDSELVTSDLSVFYFWVVVAVLVFLISRYSDPILANARRLFARGAEHDDNMRAQKLSGGDEEDTVQNSFGEKLKDFAAASKATL